MTRQKMVGGYPARGTDILPLWDKQPGPQMIQISCD